jgi:hypothetical protein
MDYLEVDFIDRSLNFHQKDAPKTNNLNGDALDFKIFAYIVGNSITLG